MFIQANVFIFNTKTSEPDALYIFFVENIPQAFSIYLASMAGMMQSR